MSITLRGTKFHYRFMMAGKDYSGPCPDCEVPAGANCPVEHHQRLTVFVEDLTFCF